MIDDDCTGASLGLRSLAGVIHDEGIELRQRPEGHFRQAFFSQRIGLARKPFEIAVLAIVDDRIGPEAVTEPEIERQIAMWR